jgi:hypothetical protein
MQLLDLRTDSHKMMESHRTWKFLHRDPVGGIRDCDAFRCWRYRLAQTEVGQG